MPLQFTHVSRKRMTGELPVALPSDLRDALTLPAFAAPMFLCSGPELAVACCKAGVIGSLTRNHCRGLEELGEQLRSVRQALDRVAEADSSRRIGPLAVNISMKLSQEDLRSHLVTCQRYGVKIIVTSAGDPTATAPIVQEHGMLHFHDVTTIRFAEKAVAAGVDGIVCIGSGGGGHAGTISHLVFVPTVRAIFDGILVMAGAVATGSAIRAAEVLGADLAYVGTRMIATKQSAAPIAYKRMLIEADVSDVIYTRGVNGLPASWLKGSLRDVGLDPDRLFIPDGRSTDHLPSGKRPWHDIWSAGQGVGLIEDVPAVEELVDRLRREYIDACCVPDMASAAQVSLASGR